MPPSSRKYYTPTWKKYGIHYVFLLLPICLYFHKVFDNRLFTPLATEVKFPGLLNKFCFESLTRALNFSSFLVAQEPIYQLININLSKLSLPRECGQRLKPLYAGVKTNDAVWSCLMRRRLALSAVDRKRLLRILKKLRDAFQDANVELILDGGTLLGSLRHHGRIPYDDDFDFRIRHDQKEKARKILKALPDTKFRDTEATIGHWKLDIICDTSCNLQIDFFFWWEGQYSLKCLEYPFNFLQSTVYPLSKRPFEGILFDSPKDPLRCIRATYDLPNIMTCRLFDHTPTRRSICAGRIDCARFEPFVPFVRKIVDQRYGTLEILIEKDRLLQIFFLPRGY